ncbi:MAG: hypothetical protein DMG96_17480 [Acidobacteria bacterium]|nr:MAG: hypothetical protein DMG96_17480 [Acidobacteriota bacterium]
MQFYTKQECEQWLSGRERVKPDEDPENGLERFHYPERPSFYYVAHWIATQLTYRMPTLVWMTEWDIWQSGENLHLYYKLRQSYGDHRLLHEAPGHLFLKHEAEDLASFLQVAMLNCWGGYILQYFNFYTKREESLAGVRKLLGADPVERDTSRAATESK